MKKHGKVVVWGLFVNTLNKITCVLNENGINAKVIYGLTPRNERRISSIHLKRTLMKYRY